MKAQIMLITLLVITILAVVVLAVIGAANRNVQQTTNSQLSERAANESENKILQIATLVGTGSITTATGISGCNTASATLVNCNFSSEEGITEIKVQDVTSVYGYTLRKDEALEIPLAGPGIYTGRIDFKINNYTALEFSLIYTESGTTRIYNDVLDPNNIYDAVMGSSTNNSLANHPLNFRYDPVQGTYYFIVSGIDGWTGAKTPVSIVLKPRLSNNQLTANIDYFPGNASFPLQMREYMAQTTVENETVISKVRSLIPLRSSVANFLYQPLIVQGSISK